MDVWSTAHVVLQASSTRAPALLECVAAMAAAPSLVPVLAGQPSESPVHHSKHDQSTDVEISDLSHK